MLWAIFIRGTKHGYPDLYVFVAPSYPAPYVQLPLPPEHAGRATLRRCQDSSPDRPRV
jgi:hypothetical protein